MSPKEYCSRLRSRLDSPFLLGQERFTGWCLGNVFSVNYYSGKEFGRRNYPISNKAIGMVTRKNDQTCVSYFIFPGMTDPISLAILFLLTFLIFFVTGTPYPVLFALGWTIAVALTCRRQDHHRYAGISSLPRAPCCQCTWCGGLRCCCRLSYICGTGIP